MAKRVKKKNGFNIDIAVVGLIIISILLEVLIFTKSGNIGRMISPRLGGLVGIIKYIVPIGTFAIAISIACHKEKYMTKKLIQYTIFILCICVILILCDLTHKSVKLFN